MRGLAVLVGGIVAIAGGLVLNATGWESPVGPWIVFWVAMFSASLTDREGFYGKKPGSRA